MALPELTDPSSQPDGEFTYRGRSFWSEVHPELVHAIREALGKKTDVSDWQVIYIGYSRAADQFVFAVDCWLTEVDEDGSPRMSCQVFDLRQAKHWILGFQVKLTSYDLGGERFYGSGEEAARERHPDLDDILLD